MITAQRAKEAVLQLNAQAAERIFDLITHGELDDANEVDKVRRNAVQDLLEFLKTQSNVEVVYAFKLYRQSDGLFMNRSDWDKGGKTYNRRNHMNAGIYAQIDAMIDKMRPRYYIYENGRNYINPNYDEEYRAYEEKKQNKEWRANFIPEEWIVKCIPINTKADIIEMSAKDFYLGKDIN